MANQTTPVIQVKDSNVGIGTTSPTNKLHVNSIEDNAYALRVQGNTENASGVWTGIGIAGEGSNTKTAIIFQDIGVSYSRGRLIFALNNAEDQTNATPANAVMTLQPGGNVLIGSTTDAGYKLQVEGSIRSVGAMEPSTTAWVDAAFTTKVGGSAYGGGLALIDGTAGWAMYSTGSGQFLNLSSGSTSGGVTARMVLTNAGAASFTSSVTASSLIKSGGTSSQYLMADGSVSTITSANVYTQTFFVPNTGATAQWTKLGTWTAAQQGYVVTIQIDLHGGYNATTTQNKQVYIYMKTSNGSSVDPNGFAADSSFWAEGLNTSIAPGHVIWESNAAGVSATTYTLYVFMPQYTNGSQYTVTTRGGSWANVETLTSPSGTTGSSTILLSENRFVVNNVLTVGGSSSGNVLIGTTTDAGYKLAVNGKAVFGTSQSLEIGNAAANPVDSGISYGIFHQSGVGLGIVSGAGGTSQGIDFWSQDGSNFFQSVRISGGNGNVGIGTITPSSRLQVAGTTSFYNGASSTGAIDSGQSETITTGFNLGPSESLDISTIGLTSNTTWKAIVSGEYANNFDGGGLTSSALEIELDSDSPTIDVGSTDITFSRNSSTGKLQVTNGNGSYRVTFVGSIRVWNYPQSGKPNVSKIMLKNVGIGTTAPATRLDVRYDDGVGSGEHNAIASFSRNGTKALVIGYRADGSNVTSCLIRSGDSTPITFGTTSANQALTIVDNGNVLIGTTTDSGYKLSVAGNVVLGYAQNRPVFYDSNGGNFQIKANAGGWATGYFFQGSSGTFRGGWGGFGGNDALTYLWAGDAYDTPTMVVYGAQGNVGIGTTEPSNKLTVTRSAATQGSETTYGLRVVQGKPITIGGDNDYAYIQSWSSGPLSINAQGNNVLFPNANTNVIIGSTTDGGFKLDVHGEIIGRDDIRILNTYALILNGSDANWRIGRNTITDSGWLTGNTTQIVVSNASSGQGFQVVNSGGTALFEVEGISGYTRISISLGVGVNPSGTTGRIDASNDIVAYSTSDKRLKENITPIPFALDKVKALTGVMFDWKEETKEAHGHSGRDTGIIAQEVQAVMPTAVRTNDTGYLAVRYEKLIGLLIEANKELADQVANQQVQIDELKKLIK